MRAIEDDSTDVPWTFTGTIGSNRLVTMGRAAPCWAPAPALPVRWQWGGEACAKAAVWHGGSWLSLPLGGFNKGLEGAELFCAAEACCLLVLGSLLVAGVLSPAW